MTPRRASARTLAALLAVCAVLTAGATSSIRIRAGDTLWAIAHRHHTTVDVLRRLNDLPGNVIYIGEVLRVPGTGAGGIVERGYTVRSGDTLSAIAARFGVTVRTLTQRNRISAGALLLVGRRLAIPVPAPGPTVALYNAGVRIPDGVRRDVAAHRAYLQSRPQPSTWTVHALIARTARRLGVDPALALAVAWNESGFQEQVVSPVDAIGIMQVLPSTGRLLSEAAGRSLDLFRAEDNVLAGVLLLAELVRATGRTDLALAGYYQGLGSVHAHGLLPQTHDYIRTVTSLRAQFRRG